MIEEFERTEVTPAGDGDPAPTNAEFAQLFVDAPRQTPIVDPTASSQAQKVMEADAAFHKAMLDVKDERKFTGFTPKSEQELVAEAFLLEELSERNVWDKADDAWQAGLFSENQLYRRKRDSRDVFYVCKTYQAALVTWPAVKGGMNIWEPNQDVEELVWRVIFNHEDYEEIPTEYVSPLHVHLQVLSFYESDLPRSLAVLALLTCTFS